MQTVQLEHLPLRAGDRVLDLGCGEGRHAIGVWLHAPVFSVGIDLCAADVARAAQRFREFDGAVPAATGRGFALGVGDALRLPFADHSFDVVICSEVLEHIGPYAAVLLEIRRVLKPGGCFVASVPRFWPEWICWALSDEYHANAGGHIRIFRAGPLEREIRGLGFERYRRHWAHALHSPFWWLKCLLWARREESRLVAWYHRLLVWDLMQRPWITRTLERLLNPLMGKSIVLYFRKATTA